MSNQIIYHNLQHSYFDIDPFSRREALYWLVEQCRQVELCTSVRTLAYLWRWHRSKVERFIKLLKNELLIETEIKSGKTVIILARQVIARDMISVIETISRQSQDNNMRAQRDSLGGINDAAKTQVKKCTYRQDKLLIKTALRQDLDSTGFSEVDFQKKEKNQKKESFEVYSIKEKTSPYGRVKKENCENLLGSLEQVSADAVSEFADSLAIKPLELEWELGKFKDHWLSSCKPVPKNAVAAFRNWLRKSIEFKEGRKNYERFGKSRPTKTRFEQFLSAGARAVAEFERSRLDRKADWAESALLSFNSCNSERFANVSPIS